MNMNKGTVAVIAVVALLIGAYIGYAYEKNKLVSMMSSQQAGYQKQISDLEKTVGQSKTGEGGNVVKSDLVMMAKNPKLGTFVTAANGMTLYTFDKDTQNKSNCTGQCAVLWPPYLVTGSVPSTLPPHIGTIKRTDGSTQYTWNGKPLYYYSGDKKAGDTNGDGYGGVWHVAK